MLFFALIGAVVTVAPPSVVLCNCSTSKHQQWSLSDIKTGKFCLKRWREVSHTVLIILTTTTLCLAGKDTAVYQSNGTAAEAKEELCLMADPDTMQVSLMQCTPFTSPKEDRWTFGGAVLPNIKWNGKLDHCLKAVSPTVQLPCVA